jgi:hypothetical protein
MCLCVGVAAPPCGGVKRLLAIGVALEQSDVDRGIGGKDVYVVTAP